MNYVTLQGSERYKFEGAIATGLANQNEWLEVSVRVRRKAALPSFDKFGLPGGPKKILSRDEFAEKYGASEQDFAKVEAFAKAHDLSVNSKNTATRTLHLGGTAAAFSAAFDVKLIRYQHANGTFRGRLGAIHIPKDLDGIITGVFGLDNRPQARKRSQLHPMPPGTSHVSKSRPWFTAPELGNLYQFPEGDGAGQTIGILEFGGGFDTKDLATYFQTIGIEEPKVLAVSVDSVQNHPNADPDSDGEVMLDIEVAGALAPKATLAVYFSKFTEKGWVDSLNAAVHDKVNQPAVLSISWGFAEGKLIWTQQAIEHVNETLQEAAALGVTVCVASGDDGSSDDAEDGHAHVDFPASSPYSLGVGGTSLKASAGKIKSEKVWNDGPRQTAGGAGGGGVSAVEPVPSWQTSLNPVSVNPGNKPGRGVPDVAAVADPNTGYYVRSGGKNGVAGGTSAAAPLWAALIALINQKLGSPVGYLNPRLYEVIGPAKVLRDITSGNNDTQGLVGGYPAGPGWDACTGWGSPNGIKLLAALAKK